MESLPLAPGKDALKHSQNDRGAVGDSMQLQYLQLLLQRPAESEAALDAFMDRQQTPGNPDYHNYLTAEQLGAKYGPSSADIATVRGWLEMHGFQVNGISSSGMRIDFSGTAGQIIESGPVDEIFGHPAHPYTRGLLDCVPQLAGTVLVRAG